MAEKTDQKQTKVDEVAPVKEAPPAPTESIWLDMATGEIVREFGDTVSRYRPGETEFALYAEMNTYEKRNDRKSVA